MARTTKRRRGFDEVDALDRGIDWPRATARASQGLTRWVLGTGLLSLHAAVFVVVGLGMLLWNILTDPADITVGAPLRSWGIVLGVHAAAVAIGLAIRRVVNPPARRPAYRPLRPSLPSGSRTAWATGPAVSAPSPNGRVTGPGAPPAAWPEPQRSVVTSRRVTTTVVATARDGFASARRRYRRQAPPTSRPGAASDGAWAGQAPAPNGAIPAANGYVPGTNGHGAVTTDAYPAADAYPPNGHVPRVNGADPDATEDAPAWGAEANPVSSWMAAISRDEVISVTQIGPDLGGDETDTDPVHSWLDGYLDDTERERDARWTWVEAAASTWLARGDAPEAALPAASRSADDAGTPEDDPSAAPPPGEGIAPPDPTALGGFDGREPIAG